MLNTLIIISIHMCIVINIITLNRITIIIIMFQVEEEPLRGQEGQLVMGVQQRFSLRPSYITSAPT